MFDRLLVLDQSATACLSPSLNVQGTKREEVFAELENLYAQLARHELVSYDQRSMCKGNIFKQFKLYVLTNGSI